MVQLIIFYCYHTLNMPSSGGYSVPSFFIDITKSGFVFRPIAVKVYRAIFIVITNEEQFMILERESSLIS